MSRSTSAVTYEARRTTRIDLIGTPLVPRSRGEAEIKTEEAGPIRIKASVRDLAAPGEFGLEYLTYVLWAIRPEGRAKNLGELRLDDGRAEIETSSDVQTFALIITAEPYYAVATPSDAVVMENVIRPDTRGRASIAQLEYGIVPRGAYIAPAGARYRLPTPGRREPPDVQQARNAIAIAQIAEADHYAPPGLLTAQRLLLQVEQMVKTGGSKRDIISHSRAAVQAAEEARLHSVTRRLAEQQEKERAQAAAREQAAREAAAKEADARRAAEDDRIRAEVAAEQAARDRQRAEQAVHEAEVGQQRAEQARREAEIARAEAQVQAAQAEALRAKAERDRVELRARLLRQFNAILETRDTARGLVVNVGDVLFETGQFALRPAAREKLARFAGVVLAHPGLMVQAEGFTDSTGTIAFNQRLSQQRADAVAEFLIGQGLSSRRVTARGYGARDPVASNETREGRQQNRRVELVVTGEVIGAPIGEDF
jgi:outer membrane protein OmpA-like peptidoglycan-associated protein